MIEDLWFFVTLFIVVLLLALFPFAFAKDTKECNESGGEFVRSSYYPPTYKCLPLDTDK